MTKISWSEELSINVEIIDNQHKKLIGMLNSLEGYGNDELGQKKVAEVLIDLVDYTKYHFSEEEKLMKEINFMEYKQHRVSHQKLIKQVTAILIRLKKGKEIKLEELRDFLFDWLMDHIKGEDLKIGAAVNDSLRMTKMFSD